MLHILLLVAAFVAPNDGRCQSGYPHAVAQLSLADAAAGRHDYRTADMKLDAALNALGKSYALPTTIDDTGMHLVLANDVRRKGKLKSAVGLKRRVLVERMQLCESSAPKR